MKLFTVTPSIQTEQLHHAIVASDDTYDVFFRQKKAAIKQQLDITNNDPHRVDHNW
jgi:hypothetical protein